MMTPDCVFVNPQSAVPGLQQSRSPTAANQPAMVTRLWLKAHADSPLSGLEVCGSGLDFIVYRSSSSRHGEVAVRIPRAPALSNDIDPSVDARQLLRQEAFIASYLADRDFPVPRALYLHESDEIDFLVSRFVPHDGFQPNVREFGRLMKRLHSIAPPTFQPVLQDPGDLAQCLAQRITRRVRVIELHTGVHIELPDRETLEQRASWRGAAQRLLHMDARAENILSSAGQIKCIVDWSNCLVGNPALELARIAEYGYVSKSWRLVPNFVAGYGDLGDLGRPPSVVELIYRLDSAVMLAVLFLRVLPDRERARTQLARVNFLASRLSSSREWPIGCSG